MPLDLRTLVFSNAVATVVCLVVVWALWRQSRGRFAGTGHWVADYALQTFGLVLILARGHIPDWASMVVSNTAVMGGAVVGYVGLERFVAMRGPQLHNAALLGLFAAVHAYFALAQPNLAARNLNLSIGLLVVTGQCAWLLLRRVGRAMRRHTAPLGMVFVAYGLVSCVRIVEFFVAEHAEEDYFRSGSFQQATAVAYGLLFILLTFGFALMVNGRLVAEVSTQEEKYAKAFRSSPYALTLTRLSDGRIAEVNDGFLAITGYASEQVVGKTTVELGLWAAEDAREQVVAELARRGAVHGLEFPFRTRSGDTITGLFSAEIVAIEDEPFVLSSIDDITPLRAEQRERERLQARLAQSDRLASMGMVAAGVAHEINNPLSYVLHNVESVAEDLPLLRAALRQRAATAAERGRDADAQSVVDGAQGVAGPELLDDLTERLADAVEGARRIKSVVKALSTFSQTQDAGLEPLDVRACVEQGLRMAASALEQRARVVKDFAPVARVLASEGQLAQVFFGVLVNAGQAVAAGGGDNEVRVRTWADGDDVLIEIADTGCGIAPEHHARVFDPFFSTKAEGEGYGLGLSIAKSIVASFGGDLTFTSELGRGTRFQIRLPRAPD